MTMQGEEITLNEVLSYDVYDGLKEDKLAAKYDAIKAFVPAALTKALRELQLLLMNPAKAGVSRHQETGRVDRKTVHRALHGATNVRKRHWKKAEITTAIMVVMDGSGSMHGSPWNAACLMMCALANMLEKAKAKFCLASFRSGCGGIGRHTWDAMVAASGQGNGACVKGGYIIHNGVNASDNGIETGCTLAVGKTFDRSLRSSKVGMARMMASPDSGTPDLDAYHGAVRMLAKVKADRKILITLADGDGWGCKRSMTRFANMIGVETMGIGIGGLKVKQEHYNAAVNVANARHLTKKVVKELVKMIGKKGKAKKVYA